MKFLIFLPCLNEAETIHRVIADLPKSISGIDSIEVLVVDDGSTDDSANAARQAGAFVISHGSNKGVGAAFQSALTYALENNFDILANIDADGQFKSSDLQRLCQPILNDEADFVSGSRFKDRSGAIENMSSIKYWGNQRMSQLISSLTGQKFYDVSCGFRAYSKEAMLRLNLHGQFTYTQESFMNLAFQGIRIVEVPIEVLYFEGRVSRVASSISSYAIRTLKIILRTYRDYRPLRFFSYLSAGFGLIGLLHLAFLFFWWLAHGKFTPHIWSGFVGAAFCFCSIIFIVVGILADMQTRLRRNQEDILYLLKKQKNQRT